MTPKTKHELNLNSAYFNALKFMVCLLIVVVTGKIVLEYRNYFPPNFAADFLQGRQDHFYGTYQWAFYPHIIAGPISLILGMVLLSPKLRHRFPRWHARMGKVQVVTVLGVLAPSGFWMSFYAPGEIGLKLGFATLSLLTGISIWFGWRSARQRDFKQHRLWMSRCYVLLCSAIVTRILGGTFLVLEIKAEWTYYLAAWASWLVPITLHELTRKKNVTVHGYIEKREVL